LDTKLPYQRTFIEPVGIIRVGMAVVEEVLERVSPSAKERNKVQRAIDDILAKVESRAKEVPYKLSVRLVGSTAKDTYVYPPDLDIFVLFPPSVPRSELERYGLGIGKGALGGEERYAEHPYIHGKFGGFEVDIVPCYAVASPSELRSAVDRTPFHTDYIASRLEPRQHDQVRLLKQFMKGIDAYSAEAKVQGFSGYLVELLILRYGDFEGVLKAAKDWKEGIRLSLDDALGREFASPVTFYDPVDRDRNVASALSLQNMAVFVRASDEFLRNPDLRFFFPRPRSIWSRTRISREMKRRGTRLVLVQLPKPKLIDDNLYPQVRRTLDGMERTLCSAGFVVLDRSFSIGRGKIDLLMELQADRLPASLKHIGPPVTSEHGAQFLEKWRDAAMVPPYIENGRWVTIIRRRHDSAKELLSKELRKAGLGSEMKGLVGMRVLSHDQLMKGGPRSSLTALLDKTAPWER
jgi:tRNA nucleotidyltransferase (CCA-adding enzyme)